MKVGKLIIECFEKQLMRGRLPVCPVCEDSIMPDQLEVRINFTGEWPRDYHIECARRLGKILTKL